MNHPFIPSKKPLPMNQKKSSLSRESILSNCWHRFGKFGVLAVSLASVAVPMAQSSGLVVDTITATIAATGQFDIKDNAVIVHSGGGLPGPILAPNTGYLYKGANLSGLLPGTPTNAWMDGYGINSSTAKLDGGDGSGTLVHGIGGILNQYDASLGGTAVFDITLPALDTHQTFYGITVGLTDILITFTIMGDADLSGSVDAFDQFLLDNSIGNGGLPGWLNGDFDYDGAITAFDQFLIDNSVANGLSVPPPAPPLGAAVPEPAAGVILMAGVIGLLSQRRTERGAKK